MTKVKVTTRFKDAFNHSVVYVPGQEVDFADEARVKDLVSRGLVEIVGGKGDEPTVFGTIDLSKPAKEVIEAVAAESEVGNLTLAQEAENAKEKPRKTVIEAVAARIAELSKGKRDIELANGPVISIVKNADGTQTAYGEDDGKIMLLASGEYRSATHIYTVGDAGEVTESELSE